MRGHAHAEPRADPANPSTLPISGRSARGVAHLPSFTALLTSTDRASIAISPAGPPGLAAAPVAPPAPDGRGGEYPADLPHPPAAIPPSSDDDDDDEPAPSQRGRGGGRSSASPAPRHAAAAPRKRRTPTPTPSPSGSDAGADSADGEPFGAVFAHGVGGRPLPAGFTREEVPPSADKPHISRVLFARCRHGKHRLNAMAPALRFIAGKHGGCRPEWARLRRREGEAPDDHRERVRVALGFGKPRGIAVIRQLAAEAGLEPPPIGRPKGWVPPPPDERRDAKRKRRAPSGSPAPAGPGIPGPAVAPPADARLPAGFSRERRDPGTGGRSVPVTVAVCEHGRFMLERIERATKFLNGPHAGCRPEWHHLQRAGDESHGEWVDRVRASLGFAGRPSSGRGGGSAYAPSSRATSYDDGEGGGGERGEGSGEGWWEDEGY